MKNGGSKGLRICIALWLLPALSFALSYSWKFTATTTDVIRLRIPAPPGSSRIPTEPGSFGDWLRDLPLKPYGSPVHLYNGSLKSRQDVHAAVVDIDTGSRDLQQCADAVIRLRAEFLFSRKLFDQIHFNFTNGTPASYARWRDGQRPVIRGNSVQWTAGAPADPGYAGFRKYLDMVFQYAGSYSLSRELEPVSNPAKMQIGDVFIQGGFPGHAVIVVDMAAETGGKKYFLLAQSYMPAQEIHVLRNPMNPELSPWYLLQPGDELNTPEWVFRWKDLGRFPR